MHYVPDTIPEMLAATLAITPPMQNGLLVIRRPVQFVAIARRFSLSVDGQGAGRLGAGGELQLSLPPGAYRLTVGLNWARRNLDVVIRSRESTEVEVGNRASWLRSGLYVRLRILGFAVVVHSGNP